MSKGKLLRRLIPYLRRHPRWLIVVLISAPLGVLAQLLQPVLLKEGIDRCLLPGDLERLPELILLFFLLISLGFGLRALSFYGLQTIGLNSLTRLRRDLFSHVMKQGQRFFDTRTTGALMTRTTQDVEAVYESLVFGAVGLITDSLQILGTLIAMLWLDWRLTLVTLLIAPFIIFTVELFRRQLRSLFTEIRTLLADLNGLFAEQVEGISVLQLNGAGERAQREFRSLAWRFFDRYRRANWWDAALFAIMDGLSALALGLMLAYGGHRLAEGALSLGLLVAFVDYLQKVFRPIKEFSGRIATIQRALAALERVFGILDTDEQIHPGEFKAQGAGTLSFEGVSFSYGGPPVLQDLSFQIKPGEVVALVGATGSGKSSIARLLLRLYEGYEGSIRLDGQELKRLEPRALREQICLVPQDPFLFEGSLAENISLWRPGIDAEARARALKQSRAVEFISEWPEGEMQQIKSRGNNLSQGQRQLVNLTRALLRHAPFVILDEATASVDSLTEERIDSAIQALFKDRTVLVIAHRLSTIARADRVLVLHQGRLVESGSHEELVKRGGRYALLVEAGFAL